jgi:hypothetical protein
MIKRTNLTTTLPLIVLLGLSACNLPQPQPTQQNVTVLPNGGTPGPDGTITAQNAVPATASPSAAVTSTPAGDPPEGWLEYANPEMHLRLYHPPDWEVTLPQANLITVRSPDGIGWLEISIVDAANAHEFSVPPETVSNAEAMIQSLLSAAVQEGDFAPAYRFDTRFGANAWATQGTYTIMEDNLWFAVIEQRDRAVLARGHAAESVEDWATSLIPLYEQIAWTIEQTVE